MRYQSEDGKRQYRRGPSGWEVRYRNYYGKGWGKWIPYAGIGEPVGLDKCKEVP